MGGENLSILTYRRRENTMNWVTQNAKCKSTVFILLLYISTVQEQQTKTVGINTNTLSNVSVAEWK